MAEVLCYCAECGSALEEYTTKLEYGCLAIDLIPCEECLANREADTRQDYE